MFLGHILEQTLGTSPTTSDGLSNNPIQFHSKLKGEWLGEPQEVVTRKVEKKARSSLISFCESATHSQSEMLTAACVYEAEKFALPRRNVSSILYIFSYMYRRRGTLT